MGIISFIKGGAKELAIARDDRFKDIWVYKHPDKTIPNRAQLTVDTDEIALFFRDGQYVGQFGAGRHTLESSNIPWLNMLVDKFTGGDVFMAEVFFVNTREHPGIKFGTSVGDVPDPQTGLRVRLMVHGSFSAKVYDPIRFVSGLVGQRMADNSAFLGWFKSQIQKTIKENIAELIVKQNWPVMRVTSGAYTSDIETATLNEVRKDIDPYGVEIIRFGDFSISMDAKDRDRLDKLVERAAYINMTGGLQGYQQFAQAEMMMNAGEGMKRHGGGTGSVMDGAGIGLGFGMAGQMMNQMGGMGMGMGMQYGHPPPQARPPIQSQMGGMGMPYGHPPPQAQPPQAQAQPPVQSQAGADALVDCSACGSRVSPGRFCSACGASLVPPASGS